MIPFYIETYGCQMNVSDSQVVAALLADSGYEPCQSLEEARVILINTCSIRENAEQRVWGRLDVFRQLKRRNPELRVGVLGCMATRLKDELLKHPAVDWVIGPDSYRMLPRLMNPSVLFGNELSPVQTKLSMKETYADVMPLHDLSGGVSAFVTIMRGCNNMCAYCVVPYVRGGERSRDPFSIEREVRNLVEDGFGEVTLLGQNVDSYCWQNPETGETTDFARLLERVAGISPGLRVRFTTSHPKDMNDNVLYAMARWSNICRHIHLPVQSGSDAILQKMNRKYTRASYLQRIARIREVLPGCAITSDMIAGFCSETEDDHLLTLSLMREVRYDQAFMFQYSERPNTYAARHYSDDVPADVKTRRLNEIIALQNELSMESNKADIGRVFEVLVEGESRRSADEYFGRTGTAKVCVFPRENCKTGDYVQVQVTSCTPATLLGKIV